MLHRQLDIAILQTMEEPISVNVSRVMGNVRTPLLLPSKGTDASGVVYGPGDGWEKAEIQQLEGWLATDFAGGGLYNIKIVDAKGAAYEWQPWFDPKTYPVRVPATMQPTMQGQAAASSINSQQSSQPMEAAEWPPRNLPSFPLVTPIPSQVPMSFPPFPYSNIGRVSSADEERRRFEDRERALQDQLAKAEREKIEEKNRADLARIEAEHNRRLEELKASLAPKADDATNKRLDKLEAMFEKLLDKVSMPTPTGPTPEMLALQEQNRQFQARLEAAEIERRHAEQMAELRRQVEALANRPTGPDPVMSMVIDAMKDGQRQMQNVIDGMRHQTLTPQDVLNLAKSTSHGVDELRTSVVRAFGEMFDLQKRAFESAAQMLPQGESPAVRIVEQGIEKAGEMFEKWQESKDAGQVAAARAAAAQAKAQEAAINAQRDQLNQMAAREERLMNQRTATAQANVAHAPSRVEGQLAGAPVTPPAGQPSPQPSNVIPLPERRLGKTDQEWFGGAVMHVERLREAVTEFLNGLPEGKLTPEGKPVGASPEDAASFIARSVEQIVKANLVVPAFNELFLANQLDDFAMVLLPHAPPQYRKAMLDELEKLHEGDDDGDDDDEGEDDDEDADDEETAKKPAEQPAPKGGGKGPARRAPQPRA